MLNDLLKTRTPEEYAAAAVLAREVGETLLTRLDLIALKPQVIVDLGCGVGDVTALLRKRYPDAKIIAIDASNDMLTYAKQQRKITAEWLCSSMQDLPLLKHSVDLLVANLVLPWCETLNELISSWRHILRPDGLFMFTTLGPDTLRELHQLPLLFPHVIDMHDLGDVLTHTGFKDPVLDVNYYNFTYKDRMQLFYELTATGMIAGNVAELKNSLTKNNQDVYPVTYEVIFGHAFGPPIHADHVADAEGVVRIPISHILKR